MKRILAQAGKEWRQFRRDRLTVAVSIAMPVMMLLLYGTAIQLDITNIRLAVEDLDNTPLSRAYVEQWAATNKFIVEGAEPGAPLERLLETSRARVALRIPPGFERRLMAGRGAEVQLLVDGTDANTATLLRNIASAVSLRFWSARQAAGHPPAVELQVQHWYNPGLSDLRFFGTGALGMVLIVFPALLGALAASREHEYGTVVQAYASTLTAREWVLGMALTYVLVSVAIFLMCFLLGLFVFGYALPPDPTPLVLGTLFYLSGAVLWGMMVGNLTGGQAAAIQAVQLGGFLISLLLSGFLVPVGNIPVQLRWISFLLPARHYIDLLRDALLRGGGWAGSGVPVLMLGVLAAVFLAVNLRRMRRMQFPD